MQASISDNPKRKTRQNAYKLIKELRTYIITGEWQYKSRIPSERDLALSTGSSRGTIRKALSSLVEEGLIEIHRGSGAYVTFNADISADKIIKEARPLELIDARFALEPHICRLAVLHCQEHNFHEMEEILTIMEKQTNDAKQFAELDAAFHLTLAKSTGNYLLAWIISQINAVRTQEFWYKMREQTLNKGIITTYSLQHRQIVDSIRARKPEQAANYMKEHLQTARLSLNRAAQC